MFTGASGSRSESPCLTHKRYQRVRAGGLFRGHVRQLEIRNRIPGEGFEQSSKRNFRSLRCIDIEASRRDHIAKDVAKAAAHIALHRREYGAGKFCFEGLPHRLQIASSIRIFAECFSFEASLLESTENFQKALPDESTCGLFDSDKTQADVNRLPVIVKKVPHEPENILHSSGHPEVVCHGPSQALS